MKSTEPPLFSTEMIGTSVASNGNDIQANRDDPDSHLIGDNGSNDLVASPKSPPK